MTATRREGLTLRRNKEFVDDIDEAGDKEKVDLRLEKEKLDLDKSYLESKSNLERSQSGNERKSGREGVETSFGRGGGGGGGGGGGREVGEGGKDVVSLDRAVKEDQRVLRGVEGTKSGEDSSERIALPLEPTVRIETR